MPLSADGWFEVVDAGPLRRRRHVRPHTETVSWLLTQDVSPAILASWPAPVVYRQKARRRQPGTENVSRVYPVLEDVGALQAWAPRAEPRARTPKRRRPADVLILQLPPVAWPDASALGWEVIQPGLTRRPERRRPDAQGPPPSHLVIHRLAWIGETTAPRHRPRPALASRDARSDGWPPVDDAAAVLTLAPWRSEVQVFHPQARRKPAGQGEPPFAATADVADWRAAFYQLPGQHWRPAHRLRPGEVAAAASVWYGHFLADDVHAAAWADTAGRRFRLPARTRGADVLTLDTSMVLDAPVVPVEWTAPLRRLRRSPGVEWAAPPDVAAQVITVAGPYRVAAASVFVAGAVAGTVTSAD